MALRKGTILENRYRIDTLLSEGGMGAVYQAFDTNLNNSVAIKENFFQTPQSIRQFKQEAHILARLRHPNLPRVIHHFTANQRQYLVMDFIEGRDLWEIIQKQGHPLEEAPALIYMLQICDAVSYLHRQNPPIIHRDIKPQNIKITPDDQAVLVDFGISKVGDDDDRTRTGARAVTPGFSPPEQHGGTGTTPVSDVYALGATLYAVLVGQKPPDSVSRIVGGSSYEPPHTLNPKLSREVSATIEHAMQIRQVDRPQSVGEWRDQLERILAGATGMSEDDPDEAPTVKSSDPLKPTLSDGTSLSPTSDDERPVLAKSGPFRWWIGAGLIAVVLVVGLAVFSINQSRAGPEPTIGSAVAAASPAVNTEATVMSVLTAAAQEQATTIAQSAATATAIAAATATEQTKIEQAVPTETPTSRPTPSPTFTPTVADTPTPALPIVTINSDINVRAGPGTNYEQVGELSAGATVKVVGRNEDSSWWQIRLPESSDSVGWIAAALGTAENISEVALATIPPTPTNAPIPTPTLDILGNPGTLICSVSDPVEDHLPGHIDFTEVSIFLLDEQVTVVYTLRDLPEELPFNRPETAGNPESSWTVRMDIDVNNTTGGFDGQEYGFVAQSRPSSAGLPETSIPIQDLVELNILANQGNRFMSLSGPKYLAVDSASNKLTLSGQIPGITPRTRFVIRTRDYMSPFFWNETECISN